MPAATRQQADEEERVATVVALGEAQGQAEQVAAAEQAAKDALELEWLAREEAEKAWEALEARLAALEAGEASASDEDAEAGPALSADAILGHTAHLMPYGTPRSRGHNAPDGWAYNGCQ
eukprot:COSAG02_NODE_150_length_33596_cov_61.953966_2_plen_120_part_00